MNSWAIFFAGSDTEVVDFELCIVSAHDSVQNTHRSIKYGVFNYYRSRAFHGHASSYTEPEELNSVISVIIVHA